MTQKGNWTAEFIIHSVVGLGMGIGFWNRNRCSCSGCPEQVQWIANNFKAPAPKTWKVPNANAR